MATGACFEALPHVLRRLGREHASDVRRVWPPDEALRGATECVGETVDGIEDEVGERRDGIHGLDGDLPQSAGTVIATRQTSVRPRSDGRDGDRAPADTVLDSID